MTAPRLFMPPQRPAHVPADLAFGCLGAAWSRGDLGFLDSAVGEEAVLRQPGHVGTGPGSAMAEALADLAAFPGAEILARDCDRAFAAYVLGVQPRLRVAVSR